MVLIHISTVSAHWLLVRQYSLGFPAIYEWREFVEDGGLMSYGTSLTEAYRQAGNFASVFLKAQRLLTCLYYSPASTFEFVINFKTAKAIGLEVPLQLQQRADEVIE